MLYYSTVYLYRFLFLFGSTLILQFCHSLNSSGKIFSNYMTKFPVQPTSSILRVGGNQRTLIYYLPLLEEINQIWIKAITISKTCSSEEM